MTKRFIQFAVLFLILLTGCQADLYTKRLVVQHLKDAPSLTVIDGFVELSYTENTGMIFGIFDRADSQFKNVILIALNIISILFVLTIIWRLRALSFIYHLPFFIILSGAFANLIDRMSEGSVVDFIHIHWKGALDWPFLFNVADVWICAGGVVLLALFIRKKDILEKVIHGQCDNSDQGQEI
jgi:signal peptidase II